MTASSSPGTFDAAGGGTGHGFASLAHDSQAVFRTVMHAIARPGTISTFDPRLQPPEPLFATTAALVLALADFETTIWLDAPLAENGAVRDYLKFHCGSRIVAHPHEAAFAIVSRPATMPQLIRFNQGLPAFPDRSTTVIVEVEALYPEGWRLHGPGIKDDIAFSAAPLPADFGGQLVLNRDQFPLGVDLIFVTATEIAALPRSVRLRGG
ncbi:MAG: phosphonate C-P lyase system protein PhnH, partial [Hyphomicrobium sp.]|nr:phosphonate C-P lyase system protein PhnH [Hyphomicrobium sp.]